MIKLRYAILGSVIPMFVLFYYSNNIIDDLYSEINTLKDKGIGKHSGIYQVRDTMNPKHTNRVDILKTPGSSQFKYDDVTMYRYVKYNNDEMVDNS